MVAREIGVCHASDSHLRRRRAHRSAAMLARFADKAVVETPAPQAAGCASRRPQPMQSRPASTSMELTSGRDGHFRVDARVDGRRIDFMVDTGASLVILREIRRRHCRHPSDAARLHRDRLHRQRQDQGGAGQARRASRSATSPCSTCRRWCCPTRRCRQNLLGVSFLSRLRRYEYANGRMLLEQ